MEPDPAQRNRQLVANSLVASGLLLIVAGVGVGIAVDPVFLAIAAVGVADLGLAWAFRTGRLGAGSAAEAPTASAPDTGPDAAAREATDDPSYNPYARED